MKAQSGEIDEKTVENDYQERQACRFLIGYHNCSNHFNEYCFADNELQMMRDNEMAVMMGMLHPSRLPKWDSEKCPPTKYDSTYSSLLIQNLQRLPLPVKEWI